jgi:hypothetical protein
VCGLVLPRVVFIVQPGDTLWLVEPLEVLGLRVPAAVASGLRSIGVLDSETLGREFVF